MLKKIELSVSACANRMFKHALSPSFRKSAFCLEISTGDPC